MYNLNHYKKIIRRNDRCSNASITEILGINDNNLVILGNEKENIKEIEYTVLRGKLPYRRRKNYLPRILSIDEFKSVNTVDASMSVNLTDLEGGHIFDILVDRRQRYLFEYFNSYPLKVRKRVEYVTTDMYKPYIDLAKKVFPHANIVVDKFHIVQLLTRELNKLRIDEMKKLNTRTREYKILKRYWKIPLRRKKDLNSIYFYKNRHFKNMTSSIDILDYMLKEFTNLKEAYDFYQNFLLSISKNDVAMLEDILNTRADEIPMCFRKSIKTLKKLRKYVVNSLKYDYTNAMVEGKNNKTKVIKRVSYGYRSFSNFKARIMLMERYKIQKGNIHSYKFAMDAAA